MVLQNTLNLSLTEWKAKMMTDWKLLSLIEEFIKDKWRGVIHIKAKKLNSISTNDLDDQNKLYPDYKERRERRKKKGDESKSFAVSDTGMDDIWKD